MTVFVAGLAPPHACVCLHCQADMERYQNERDYTHGNWATEAASVTHLLDLIERSEMFNVWREVTGSYIQPRAGAVGQKPRIDIILGPRQPLIDVGWDFGFIGIECKRSGEKIGRPLSQMLDYSRALWDLDRSGRRVGLNWIFLWPLYGQGGPVASLMAQNCLGNLTVDRHGNLHFQTGGTNLIIVSADGVAVKGTRTGRKVGSR